MSFEEKEREEKEERESGVRSFQGSESKPYVIIYVNLLIKVKIIKLIDVLHGFNLSGLTTAAASAAAGTTLDFSGLEGQ